MSQPPSFTTMALFPADWDERQYLDGNPDVRARVGPGQSFVSGYDHYQQFGKYENRVIGWISQPGAPLTRSCKDPWQYLEVDTEGQLRPCCILPGLITLKGSASESIDALRNGPEFRKLRRELLTGELNIKCQNCHIRPWVPVSAFARQIESLSDSSSDMQAMLPLLELRLDITKRCNLRCVYCAVSQPGYQGRDIADHLVEQILPLAREYGERLTVSLNGHGETTYHPKWIGFAKAIQDAKCRVSLLSNFAKPFDDDEINVLAKMHLIQISLDTIDDNLLRATRRHVSFGTVLRNMYRIKVRARQLGTFPSWSISCGIYDPVFHGLEDLAWFVIEAGFKTITFWNLVEYPPLTEPAAIQVRSLSALPEPERQQAFQIARRVVSLLSEHGVAVSVAGDFLKECNAAH